jgi:hypothetical protein
MTLRPPRFYARKSILNSFALLTLLFGISTPNGWSQQSAKAAVADRPASPSDPAAAPKTAAAVLKTIELFQSGGLHVQGLCRSQQSASTTKIPAVPNSQVL